MHPIVESRAIEHLLHLALFFDLLKILPKTGVRMNLKKVRVGCVQTQLEPWLEPYKI